MNSLSIFASCVFCDISFFAISWWLSVALLSFLGLLFGGVEIYNTVYKKKVTSKQARLLVSLSQSVLFGTIISYEVLSSYEYIDGFGTLPVITATLITTCYFVTLSYFKHTTRSHIYSFAMIIATGFLLWIVNTVN